MGSNLILHKFLCSYYAIYEMKPDILERVGLKIYICPESGNDLGRFLAWTDAWYKRHVFSPFACAVPLAPQYSANDEFPTSILSECKMHNTLPVRLLREMLQHYVRCAEHTERISVFEVKCWAEESVELRRISCTRKNDDGDRFRSRDGAPLDKKGSKAADPKDQSNGGGSRISEEKMPLFGITPSVVVPFITSLEIGILTQVSKLLIVYCITFLIS